MPKSTYVSNKNSSKIYLDYAAATPLEPAVSRAMQKTYQEHFASPSSIHGWGVKAKNVLDKARGEISEIFHAHADEIIFTSGSTESNNLAIRGVFGSSNSHMVTTNIEHSSVSEVLKHLEDLGKIKVNYVPVESNGIVDPKKIRKALRPHTVLVSVGYANSEIGTVQPLREIAKEIRHYNKLNSKRIIFHTDATQALNYLPLGVEKLGVDLMSFSGVKIYGPKGVGGLYVKRNTPIQKIIFGGDQQSGMRAGSYNLPGIVGLAEALKITENIKEEEVKRLTTLRNYFFAKLGDKLILNGDKEARLPNNINITIPKIPSDLLVIELSAHGIMASSKSACKSGDGKASHVIQAINPDIRDEDGSLRFSLGRQTTKKDIDYAVKALSQILKKLKKWYN